MERVYAFTDESGNHGFDFNKPDISTYFIITSIIVAESDLEQIELEVERIRKKYFQTGEIKSSSVGKNHKRRIRILSELLQCKFKIFSVVINKKQILEESALMHKKTFYKFVNNIVHKELRNAFSKITICADQLGGNKYMVSFSKYVKSNEEVSNLFGEREFYFQDSKNSVMIQLADFISGTLSFVYEEIKQEKEAPNYLKLLNKSIIRIEQWPKIVTTYVFKTNSINSNYDLQIANLCFRQAQSFIVKNNESEDDEVINRLNVLKYLCFRFINNDTRKYISTKELINHLSYKTNQRVTVHYFRSKIIAKLRDAGVIISSSSQGYKIPSSEEELYNFINHGTTVILPMLHRIKKCRDTVKLATMGELDLFEHTEYGTLKKYFEVVDSIDE